MRITYDELLDLVEGKLLYAREHNLEPACLVDFPWGSGGAIDGRDVIRLVEFFHTDDLERVGMAAVEFAEAPEGIVLERPWTDESIKECLKRDVGIGFTAGLAKKMLTANGIAEVCQMWCWLLGDEEFGRYQGETGAFGLTYFKQVALKYGFDNKLGDDWGDEPQYKADMTHASLEDIVSFAIGGSTKAQLRAALATDEELTGTSDNAIRRTLENLLSLD